MKEIQEQRTNNIVAYIIKEEIDYYLHHHQKEYIEQNKMDNPIAYKASTNPDILYYHQAMQDHDRDKFQQAVIDEANAHIEGKHWELVKKENIPPGKNIID